jgi:hypothetical protein
MGLTTKRKATGVRKHTFRSAYNVGSEDYSELHNPKHALTEQEHLHDCDINRILAQFLETGMMPNLKKEPQYGDVSEIDFQDIQTQLANAKTLFEELPEHVKDKFDNEPFKFLQFAENPENNQALVEMGLANAPKEEHLAQSLEGDDENATNPGDSREKSVPSDKSDKSDASDELST